MPIEGSSLQPRSRELSLLLGCSFVYSVGYFGGWLAPQIMADAIQRYGVSAAQAGTLTMTESGFAGLLAILLGALPPPLTHRQLAIIGLTLSVGANGVVSWAPGFWSLLADRTIAGVADAFLVMVAVSLIAMRSANPDRGFAIINIANCACGALTLAVLLVVSPESHALAFLSFVAIFTVIAAPLMRYIPSATKPGRFDVAQIVNTRSPRPAADLACFIVLLGIMVPICTQQFMLFVFGPALGQRLGMSDAAINATLSTSMLASIAGPFLAIAMVRRFGRWTGFFSVSLLLFGFNLVLTSTTSPGVFRLGQLFNLLANSFLMPLLLAWAADLDPSGRYSTILTGGIVLTTALTPVIAGAFVDESGVAALLPIVVTTGTAFIALLILLRALLAHRHRAIVRAAAGEYPSSSVS